MCISICILLVFALAYFQIIHFADNLYFLESALRNLQTICFHFCDCLGYRIFEWFFVEICPKLPLFCPFECIFGFPWTYALFRFTGWIKDFPFPFSHFFLPRRWTIRLQNASKFSDRFWIKRSRDFDFLCRWVLFIFRENNHHLLSPRNVIYSSLSYYLCLSLSLFIFITPRKIKTPPSKASTLFTLIVSPIKSTYRKPW